MIDNDARTALAENIRHLVAGVISNDEFEKRIPLNSPDPAIQAIFFGGAWQLYSDLQTMFLRDKHRASKAVRKDSARWILFLKSGLPYEWPHHHHLLCLLWLPFYIITLGRIGVLRRSLFARHGDLTIWPFIRRSDFEKMLASNTNSSSA